MGVSGSGKTTIGRLVSERLGWAFIEGDAFHPAANIAKMAGGRALDDADRRPWLEALARELDGVRAAHGSAVLACSALKRSYRAVLGGGASDIAVVFLTAPVPVLRERMRARPGHFMPASLLESQLATLEPPSEEEFPGRVRAFDVSFPPNAVADAAAAWLRTVAELGVD